MKSYTLTITGQRGIYEYPIYTALDVMNNLSNVLTAYLSMAGVRYNKFVEKAIQDGNYTISPTQ